MLWQLKVSNRMTPVVTPSTSSGQTLSAVKGLVCARAMRFFASLRMTDVLHIHFAGSS